MKIINFLAISLILSSSFTFPGNVTSYLYTPQDKRLGLELISVLSDFSKTFCGGPDSDFIKFVNSMNYGSNPKRFHLFLDYKVAKLLDEGVDIDSIATALLIATRQRFTGVVKILLEKGKIFFGTDRVKKIVNLKFSSKDSIAEGSTMLMSLVERQSFGNCKYMNIYPGEDYIKINDIAKLLIEHGANIYLKTSNGKSVLAYLKSFLNDFSPGDFSYRYNCDAEQNEKTYLRISKTIKFLNEIQERDEKIIKEAIGNCDKSKIKNLVKMFFNKNQDIVDFDGNSMLHYAAIFNSGEAFDCIWNLRPDLFNKKNDKGQTPVDLNPQIILHLANLKLIGPK